MMDGKIEVKAEPTNEVVVHKFYLEIQIYPGGKVFPKIVPLGKFNKGKAKTKAKKKLTKLEVKTEEVY